MDSFAKVNVKFYICQIQAAIPYLKYKEHEEELERIFIECETEFNNPNLMEIDENETQNNKNENINENQTNPSSNQKKKTYTEEEKKLLKKLFVYENKIFSRVEIMGLIIQINSLSQSEGSARKIITIDDTTGVIQCILWKNKVEKYYNDIDKELSVGQYIDIVGQIDYFANKFEIIVEKFRKVDDNINWEMLFHQTLQKNIEDIKKANIRCENPNSSTNIYYSDTQQNKQISNITFEDQNPNKKIYELELDFANRLLAFFLNYKMSCETEDEIGYSKFTVKNLLQEKFVVQMIEDFFGDSNDNTCLKCLQNTFEKYYEKNTLGRIIYNETGEFSDATLEIKNDISKIKQSIIDFINTKSEENPMIGATFEEIVEYINEKHGKFYKKEFVKFILKKMTEDSGGKIMEIPPNSYIIP